MAKRARGSTTRPGQRAPLQRAGSVRPIDTSSRLTTDAAPVRPASLTAEEEARAAELEARIVAEERAAEETAKRSRERGRRATAAAEPVGRGGSLAVQAAEEYAYVARDVRRIAIIGGGLVAILIALWAVLQATGATLV